MRSKRLLEPLFRVAKALGMAAQACRATSAPEMAVRAFSMAASTLEMAAQDDCSKVLVSVTLCSVPHCSVLLAPFMDMNGFTLVYIYGYIYIHTHIYIYIFIYIPVYIICHRIYIG